MLPDFSWIFVVLHGSFLFFVVLFGSSWIFMFLQIRQRLLHCCSFFCFFLCFFLHGFHGFPQFGSSFMIWFFVILVVLCGKISLHHARPQKYSSLKIIFYAHAILATIFPCRNSRIVCNSPRTIPF
jgi:hypothetical protein